MDSHCPVFNATLHGNDYEGHGHETFPHLFPPLFSAAHWINNGVCSRGGRDLHAASRGDARCAHAHFHRGKRDHLTPPWPVAPSQLGH